MRGKYNEFDYSKIVPKRKITPPTSPPPNRENSLTYSFDHNNFTQELKSMADLSVKKYQVLDDTRPFFTKSSYLIQKVHQISELDERAPSEENKETKEGDTEKTTKNSMRYFDDINDFSVLSMGNCRRCQQPGHYAKWCTEPEKERVDVCYFCLGDHFYVRCPNTLCFNCNQVGHMSKDCKDRDPPRCHNCNIKGHLSRNCNVLSDGQGLYETRDMKSMKCMICHVRGHLNCASMIKDTLYYEGWYSNNKKAKKSNKQILEYNYVAVDEYEDRPKKKHKSSNSHDHHKVKREEIVVDIRKMKSKEKKEQDIEMLNNSIGVFKKIKKEGHLERKKDSHDQSQRNHKVEKSNKQHQSKPHKQSQPKHNEVQSKGNNCKSHKRVF